MFYVTKWVEQGDLADSYSPLRKPSNVSRNAVCEFDLPNRIGGLGIGVTQTSLDLGRISANDFYTLGTCPASY